jgi:glycine oxidase
VSAHSDHIAIAGAGLLGRLLAWRLLRKGYAVTLYEAGALSPSPAAAFTAAGMISPLSEAVVSDRHIYQMGMFALQQWPHWLAEFSAPDIAQGLFSQRGSLVIAHPQDLGELQQFIQELRHVLPGTGGYHTLDQTQIQQLEPDLNPHFQQGLLLEDEGHIDNRYLLNLLLEEIHMLGGQCVEHCPVQVKPHAIISAGGEQKFELVIDCRGVGAKSQLQNLRGVRGETMYVQTPEVRLQRPVRLMHPRYQLYVVPKPEQRFIIGATQIESEDRSPISLQSSLELASALYTLAPAFAEARIIETGVNLRPAFMDNMPQVHAQPGLISANGLFRHGFLLAPAVVTQVLAHIFDTQPLPFDISGAAHD